MFSWTPVTLSWWSPHLIVSVHLDHVTLLWLLLRPDDFIMKLSLPHPPRPPRPSDLNLIISLPHPPEPEDFIVTISSFFSWTPLTLSWQYPCFPTETQWLNCEPLLSSSSSSSCTLTTSLWHLLPSSSSSSQTLWLCLDNIDPGYFTDLLLLVLLDPMMP